MARTKKAEVVKNVKENREPETLEEFTKIIDAAQEKFENSLSEMTQSITSNYSGLTGWYGAAGANPCPPPNSRIDTVFINTRYTLISNFRNVLNNAYTEYGIIKTLCEQPVRDAFRTGFTIKGRDLDTKEIQELEYYYEKNQLTDKIIEALVWGRLFGGGGLIVNCGEDTQKPFDINRMRTKKRGGELEFIPADMWELYPEEIKNMFNPFEDDNKDNMFVYYTKKLHPSRVILTKGEAAPSMIKPRLRGWGLSVLEKSIRSINSYLKNQNLIFELLDEAKIDIYQIQGFNQAMLTNAGTARVQKRIQNANILKNYQQSLILDANDKYEQKQLSFNGLSEILTQIRQGVASDLKMPMTKLFGVSAAGFNAGEDDIENYNGMIESEIRSVAKFIVIKVLEICCKYLFDKVPENLNIDFKSLREMPLEQEEHVKNSTFNRLIQARANGLLSNGEFMLGCNNDGLLPITFPEKMIQSQMNLYKTEVDYDPYNKNPTDESRIFGKAEEQEQRTADDKEIKDGKGEKNIDDKEKDKDFELFEKTDTAPIVRQHDKKAEKNLEYAAQATTGNILKPRQPKQAKEADKTATVDENEPLPTIFEKSNLSRNPEDDKTKQLYKKEGFFRGLFHRKLGVKEVHQPK